MLMHVKCQFCPFKNFSLCLSLFIKYLLFGGSKNYKIYAIAYSLDV